VLQAALSLVRWSAPVCSQQQVQATDLKLDSRNRYIVHINPRQPGIRRPS
jgi:hypothetical protein